MTNIYQPKMYYQDIFSINYQLLKKKKIKYLIFDLDNTIADCKTKIPSKKVNTLFKDLKRQGFTIYIMSNAFKRRVKSFANSLNTKYYYLSLKPLKITFKRLIKENNLKINEIAMIGDEIFTDIKGSNKLGITSILVDRLTNNDYFLTKISRIRENNLFKRTNIIKRGEYYE